MQRYIVVRLLQTIVALWAVSIIVFALARITGNPLDTLLSFEATLEDRERVAAALGLDRSLYTQYFIFVGNVLRGEFGESFKWRLPASELVFGRFPASLALAGLAITIATLVAVPLGVITAVKRDSVLDYGGKALALIGQAAPPFWLGLVLIWVFGVELGVVPTSGRSGWSSYVLPAVSLGLFWVAALMRLIRSSMLDALDSEYVKLARVKACRSIKSSGSTHSATRPSLPSPTSGLSWGRCWWVQYPSRRCSPGRGLGFWRFRRFWLGTSRSFKR